MIPSQQKEVEKLKKDIATLLSQKRLDLARIRAEQYISAVFSFHFLYFLLYTLKKR
jgi:hypothetical protein